MPAHKTHPVGSLGRGALKIGVPLLLIAGVLWADSEWHFLPHHASDPGPAFDLPDRWSSDDRHEGATIDCELQRDTPAGGGIGFRLTVQAMAGAVHTGGKLYPERSGRCRVEIRDPNGGLVLFQDMPLTMLASSPDGGGGYRGRATIRGRHTVTVIYTYKGHTIGKKESARL